MFQLMRNTHLAIGLAFFMISMIFAVSSLFVIYRDWIPDGGEAVDSTLRLEASNSITARELALELMREHGIRGDMMPPNEQDGVVKFRINQPSVSTAVEYVRATGETKVTANRQGFFPMLLSLHVNHGFWHELWAVQAWAALSLTGSIALLLLGATGIYLWFVHHEERMIGGILLGGGLVYGITALILTRLGV